MITPGTPREYRSTRTWRGRPLVHVALGGRDIDGRYRVGRARAVVAVGGVAVGFVAVGGIAVGLVSAGGVSVGVFAAVGGVAVAAIAVGAVSVGVLAVGVVALGVVAVGILAVGATTSSVTPAGGVTVAGARSWRAPRADRAAFVPDDFAPLLPGGRSGRGDTSECP
jgi:hypothetical protein